MIPFVLAFVANWSDKSMSIAYQQAANVIQQFWDKKASLKTLIYGSSFPKKVQEIKFIDGD